jgi:cysteine-rich repeat protein
MKFEHPHGQPASTTSCFVLARGLGALLLVSGLAAATSCSEGETGDRPLDSTETTAEDSETAAEDSETSAGASETSADPDCGDGVVDLGETCDDGNMINTDACTNACEEAACGDGIFHEGVEECDDGNTSNSDDCTAICTIPACGDGIISTDEECDDGGKENGDGCSALCFDEYKFVFVTSQTFLGNFGGFAAADAVCNTLAGQANLPGEYRAWLSDSNVGAYQRLTHANVPYVLPGNAAEIATSWNDLVDGSIAARIDVHEDGTLAPAGGSQVWTGTNAEGGLYDGSLTCADWTSASDSNEGWTGYYNSDTPTWTSDREYSCADEYRLYCVQQ